MQREIKALGIYLVANGHTAISKTKSKVLTIISPTTAINSSTRFILLTCFLIFNQETKVGDGTASKMMSNWIEGKTLNGISMSISKIIWYIMFQLKNLLQQYTPLTYVYFRTPSNLLFQMITVLSDPPEAKRLPSRE